ncbi:LOW QUALITY PROTEIN: telomere repeats-binding bouquet formation protein 1 [Aulostomus maculatus]
MFCTNIRNTTKTDLSLLLECLKSQMKCPELQKQALLTIHSICENREDNVDLLREMGGVTFVYNLSKSSIVHSDVRETALFTLGTLAEANVYCKNSLCRKEMFVELVGWLMKEDIPLTLKRVSVYLLSVLVAGNKAGQTLAQTTGCLDILLDLFRNTFPLSKGATVRPENATQTFQLWASVSSALCGCVNNPQNEAGQHICVAAFPTIKVWLQQISFPIPEIFQPICSFIAMTVANNSFAQESFSASGVLETVTRSLVCLPSGTETSLWSCQLSVTISKTLSACITDNSNLASSLAQYGVVSHLVSLLTSPHLDCEDRLTVLLTLGHCTEASEDHQFQMVQCGGLPLIITLLAEDTNEDIRKAATFILQSCKQATMSLRVPGLTSRQGGAEDVEPITNIKGFESSAQELLSRIQLLEKRQQKSDMHSHSSPKFPSACSFQTDNLKTSSTLRNEGTLGERSINLQTVKNVNKGEYDNQVKSVSSNLSNHKEKTSEETVRRSMYKGTGAQMSSQLPSLEEDREAHTADSHLFKPAELLRLNAPKETARSVGGEMQDNDKVLKVPGEEHSLTQYRCAGCVLPFEAVTSRTFESLLSSCRQNCDMHNVLLKATEHFRTRHCTRLLRREPQFKPVELTDPKKSAADPQRSWKNWKEVSLTPICKGSGRAEQTLPEHSKKRYNGITLNPLHRGVPLKTHTSCSWPERRMQSNGGHHALDEQQKASRDCCSTQKKRKNFSHEELRYLLCGVKTYGFSWNSILWSHPFQPGRTNVDLAKKYRRLMVKPRMLAVNNPGIKDPGPEYCSCPFVNEQTFFI